jgi:hypothetical protein
LLERIRIQIVIDEITAGRTTETGLNDRDEVYFVIPGASSKGPIDITRISPSGDEDYFGLKSGEKVTNISLLQLDLDSGEVAYIPVVIREQDNAQLPAIKKAVTAYALTLAGFIVGTGNPELSLALKEEAKEQAKESAKSFINSLSSDGDQTIGAVSMLIHNQKGNLTVKWENVKDTTILSQDSSSAFFQATGGDSNYTVRVRAKLV